MNKFLFPHSREKLAVACVANDELLAMTVVVACDGIHLQTAVKSALLSLRQATRSFFKILKASTFNLLDPSFAFK